jgi:hypothetical protein
MDLEEPPGELLCLWSSTPDERGIFQVHGWHRTVIKLDADASWHTVMRTI